jgi:peptide/nickel transport system substrate-binding protein
VLVIAAGKIPNGLDHDFNFLREDHQVRMNVFQNLLELEQTANATGVLATSLDANDLVGQLAESWETSEDGRTTTVKLREGVMSHAGNELTADDVQYTWDRSWALDAVGAFYAKFNLLFDESTAGAPDTPGEPGWEVVDKYTWRITTPTSNSLMPLLLINNDLNILDAKKMEEEATADDPWATEFLVSGDAGHGPYALVEWSPGERAVFEAFDDYYRGRPFFDEVIYLAVPEPGNRRLLLENGEADVAEWLEFRDIADLEGSAGTRLWTVADDTNLQFKLELVQAREPFSSIELRQAILYATPIDDIIDSLFFGFATPGKSPVPSSFPDYNGDAWVYDYDPDKARELIASVGGEGTEFTITFASERDLDRNTAVILKTAYEDVGFVVNIQEKPGATYGTELYEMEYEAFFFTNFPILPTASYALALQYACGGFLNFFGYCNLDVDGLVQEGIASPSLDVQKDVYGQAQTLMINDVVEVWIAEPHWILATRDDLEGVSWNTYNSYDWGLLNG